MWVQVHPWPLISWEALGKQAPTAVWTSLSHPKTRVVSRAALRVSGTLGGSEAPCGAWPTVAMITVLPWSVVVAPGRGQSAYLVGQLSW